MTPTSAAKKPKDHNHHSGAGNCPVCSPHDHTDNRRAGTADGIEIPMWHLNCPHCGRLDIAMSGWSPEAVTYTKTRRGDAA